MDTVMKIMHFYFSVFLALPKLTVFRFALHYVVTLFSEFKCLNMLLSKLQPIKISSGMK